MSKPENITAADLPKESCKIRMKSGRPCTRTIHVPQDGADPDRRCLMHSADPDKATGVLLEEFLSEVEKILEEAGNFTADFTYFFFPKVNFSSRVLLASCNFFDATFSDEASFERTVFQRDAYFERACFRKGANFHQTSFIHEADFYYTQFAEETSFVECIFERNVYFSSSNFLLGADFHGAKFSRGARFRLTKFFSEEFVKNTPSKPSPIFSLVSFAQPQHVLFYKLDLSRAIFMNCDVSRIGLSKVGWRRRKGNGKRMLFEEELPLASSYAEPLRMKSLEYEDLEARELSREILSTSNADEEVFYRDYGLVADTYQQLRKNYDSRGDYWKAGDFHFGEMEMQRLSIRHGKDWLQFRKWWHPRLSFVAWYKYASAYGESFARPLTLMVVILIGFTLTFPITGIQNTLSSKSTILAKLTYKSVWPVKSPLSDGIWAEAKLIGKSGIAALDTATFQRSTEFVPSYPWGRVLAILETLITSTLFALFLLAVRRQFRR